jgi:anti-anti-sigma regulatory factor
MILQTAAAGPGVALFKIEGQLDFAGAPTVSAALADAAAASRFGRMVIDLGDLDKADEKGVASLASTIRKLCANHPSMRVVAIARDRWLAGALAHLSVQVCNTGRDALRFIHPAQVA